MLCDSYIIGLLCSIPIGFGEALLHCSDRILCGIVTKSSVGMQCILMKPSTSYCTVGILCRVLMQSFIEFCWNFPHHSERIRNSFMTESSVGFCWNLLKNCDRFLCCVLDELTVKLWRNPLFLRLHCLQDSNRIFCRIHTESSAGLKLAGDFCNILMEFYVAICRNRVSHSDENRRSILIESVLCNVRMVDA